MPEPTVVRHDLPNELLLEARSSGVVAWDIETSGLHWRSDEIGTCQLAFGPRIVIVVLAGNRRPENLCALLSDSSVTKVFHHAPFDLRFMVQQWGADAQNVACTKVASKILHPERPNSAHSLKPLLAESLGVDVSKDQQRSNWMNDRLTNEQLEYAADDVAYLTPLLAELTLRCNQEGIGTLLQRSFEYLPIRVALELRGGADVFAY